ncbi:MAG TPA: hypothetical protein VHC20_02230 [Candidatus Paceibacterota bacterium]|nr:hypothetical protein [Candidatus Paceibacterota bacterium]
MKILRLSNTCGSSCGGLDLWSVLNGSLPKEYLERYVISLRDDLWVTTLPRSGDGLRPSYFKIFSLGEAKAVITESLDNGGRRTVQIAIESPNTVDFVALYKSVYEDWLGIPHEVIPLPKYRLQEPSFVRGIRNDLHDLWQFIQNRWRRARAMIVGQFA